MYKDKIAKILREVTNLNAADVRVCENSDFGDYTSNIALISFDKNHSSSPRELAESIVLKLSENKDLSGFIEKSQVAGAGFINFWIKEDILVDNLIEIGKQKENYGKTELNNTKTAIVEYSSPNIAKPFTIGHLRSTIIGDAIANLLEATGYKVLRDNHLGDWGTQFGKQIYAIKTWGSEEKIAKSPSPVKELVSLYVKFHEEAEKDPTIEEKAREWFKKLENKDSEARRIWKKCIDWSFKEFDRIYSLLKIKFSSEFENGRGLGESFFEDKMQEVVSELEKKNLLKTGEEGAKLVFFDNEKLPGLMILKKDGASLYATRDLATDKYRKTKYGPDLIVNEVGSEQSLYFRQLFETEKLLGWFNENQRVHVGHGLIRFKEGKMSTRKGNVIWMEDVIEEAVTRAGKLGSETDELTERVAVGAIKYNDLKRDPSTDFIFNWDEILNMEGNSGPYLQYTYARCKSVMAKAKEGAIGSNLKGVNLNREELKILRTLSLFPEIILNAAKSYSPNLLSNYLFNLAQEYNNFYNTYKIINGENEGLRLSLTSGVAQVLKNGLNILGIESPEKM